jgi:hypothetical protein
MKNRAENFARSVGEQSMQEIVHNSRNIINNHSGEIQTVKNTLQGVNRNINLIIDNNTQLKEHLETSDNTFSIDNVNTISQTFSEAINKLNFTKRLISEKKDEIIAAGNYSSVLRSIFDLKYGRVITGDDFDVWVFNINLSGDNLQYFAESNDNFKNKLVSELPEPERSLILKINLKYNDSRMKLINQHNQEVYYMLVFKNYISGIQLSIDMILPDILKPNNYIIIGTSVIIGLKMPEIDSYVTVPTAFYTYLQQMENAFNTFSKIDYDSTVGTIYQFGTVSDFNKLLVVSSSDYSSWNGQLIINCYLPESNIDVPDIIRQINAELNLNYTGIHEDEIVIVSYVVGVTYYTGVVKMIVIQGYAGLCYQIISIDINKIFTPSVKITGDTEIQGNLNVLRYNGESVINTDNTRKVTTFHEKVGINQQAYEVNGLLDIDNLTHQVILDLIFELVPYSLNSYDVVQIINNTSSTGIGVSPDFTGIEEMFSYIPPMMNIPVKNPLFDYRNQVGVFSTVITATLKTTEIVIIHEIPELTNIVDSPVFFNQISQIVKEVNQMSPEISTLNDPKIIFSFIMIVPDKNKKWYILYLRAIIRDNYLIFTMTYLDVTYLMVDMSYSKMLTNIFDYIGKQYRFLNYVTLLFQDPKFFDASQKFQSEDFYNNILHNAYFSDRLNLIQKESYIFISELDFSNNVSLKSTKYTYHESNPSWIGLSPSDVYNGDVQARVGSDTNEEQMATIYGYRTGAIFLTDYVWVSKLKISLINIVSLNGSTYKIGCGVSLNTLLSQSLLVKGDNTISGNFYVNDSYDNAIFKVDNVKKIITNSYKVGVGIENPKSILHIKDTTVQDVLDELDLGMKQHNILNILINSLTTASAETEFKGIIDTTIPEQTAASFAVVYKVNTETFLSGDMSVVCHYLFPYWEGKLIKNIVDYENSKILTIVKNFFTDILNNYLLFDGIIHPKMTDYKFGKKRARVTFFKNIVTGDSYLLGIGTNILDYLRINTNKNITTLMDSRDVAAGTVNAIYLNKVSTSELPVYNFIEWTNQLAIKKINNRQIKKRQFEIILDITKPLELQVGEMDDNYQVINTQAYTDMVPNDKAKYISFYNCITKNYTDFKVSNSYIVVYEDLHVNYFAACKYVEKFKQRFSLVCVEFSIQDCIIPTLNVEGDTRIIGDLLVTDQKTNTNFVSIDPIDKFVGINTDDRYIYYDETVITGSNLYSAKHNMYVRNDHYPVLVSERTQEKQSDIQNPEVPTDPSNNLFSFDSYSSLTLKRNSDLYTFEEMVDFSQANNDIQRASDQNNITHTKYGTDITFEVSDKSGITQGLGAIKMTIDSMSQDNKILKGGFGVQVSDDGTAVRDIMYVDNSGTLFINKINLGGKLLSTDSLGNLTWDGKIVQLSPE